MNNPLQNVPRTYLGNEGERRSTQPPLASIVEKTKIEEEARTLIIALLDRASTSAMGEPQGGEYEAVVLTSEEGSLADVTEPPLLEEYVFYLCSTT